MTWTSSRGKAGGRRSGCGSRSRNPPRRNPLPRSRRTTTLASAAPRPRRERGHEARRLDHQPAPRRVLGVRRPHRRRRCRRLCGAGPRELRGQAADRARLCRSSRRQARCSSTSPSASCPSPASRCPAARLRWRPIGSSRADFAVNLAVLQRNVPPGLRGPGHDAGPRRNTSSSPWRAAIGKLPPASPRPRARQRDDQHRAAFLPGQLALCRRTSRPTSGSSPGRASML